MDDSLRKSLLFDFYSPLLTDKQKNIYILFHEEDLSLTEIGESYNISRQAVYDSIKRTNNILYNYEEKLKMVDTFNELSCKIMAVRRVLANCSDTKTSKEILALLDDMESLERK